MRQRVGAHMARKGYTARASIAGTPDAAHALARFSSMAIVLPGGEEDAAYSLPVAALGVSTETTVALTRAGLKTLGDLAVRHGLGQSIAPGLMALVGGHPQLVRLGLYAIARGESLETLVTTGATEAGLYGNHLRRVRSKLEGHLELKMAFQRVLADGGIDQTSSAALRSLGVGKLRGNEVEVTCELYRQYFRSVW